MTTIHVFAKSRPATRRKTLPKLPRNIQYITDDMLAPFVPSLFLPTSQIELTIACRNLINSHLISKADPFCIVSMKRPWQDKFKEIARTETIHNTLNPEWVKQIIVEYNFECIQNIKFEIRDKDLKPNEFLGRFETTVSELVSKYGQQYIGELVGKVESVGYREGEIVIVSEEVVSCKQVATLNFRGENLPKSWLRSSNPFLIISRSNEDGSHSVVAKTEVEHGTQNPTWKPITIRATTLCNGDFERSIRIDCYNYRDNGSHKLIGSCWTTLNSLKTCNEPMLLVNEEKQKNKPGYVATGELKLEEISIVEDFTFLDYIRNGTQMHFAVAIDYTASNLPHTDPKSLHYLCPERMNNYEIALRAIGGIIQQYDNSQLFPAFGFGAKLPDTGQVSFQFPLNDNPSHPYCSGVDEILIHYRAQLQAVELYGPTNFAPVINNTISIAKQYQDGKHYFVLLILTDGVISDMHLTKRAIIDASSLPISIIIVGIGDDNFFEAMDELDADNTKITCEDRSAERDIVQFVPLNKFLSKDGECIKSQSDLAEEVLAEIPEQLTSFMKSRGFNKTPPNEPANSLTIVPTAPLA